MIAEPESRPQRIERLLFRSLFVIAGFFGLHAALAERSQQTGLVEVLPSVAAALIATAYCAAVCRRRGAPVPGNTHWLLVMFWPVAVPACLMWALGRREWWKVPLGVLALFGTIVVAALAGILLDMVRR